MDKPSNWDEVIERMNKGEISKVEARKELGLTHATFYRMLKKF